MIFNGPFDKKLLSFQTMRNSEPEIVRIMFFGSVSCRKAVRYGSECFLSTNKFHIPRKPMLRFHGVFFVSDSIFPIHHFSNKGEKNGGMTIPYGGIADPNPLDIFLFINHANQLRAGVGHSHAQEIVFNDMHAHYEASSLKSYGLSALSYHEIKVYVYPNCSILSTFKAKKCIIIRAFGKHDNVVIK